MENMNEEIPVAGENNEHGRLELTLEVMDMEGKNTGREVVLPRSVFSITPKEHVLFLDIVSIRNRNRQGTAKTKDKSEITASTRKLLKQKGSGNARKGSAKAGILRGGGSVFGPQPRDYGFKLNKKEKKLARRSALAVKLQKSQLAVIEDVEMKEISTKQYITMLERLNIQKKKVLWVVPEMRRNFLLSSRNVKRSKTVMIEQVNSYDLIDATFVVFFESCLPEIEKHFV